MVERASNAQSKEKEVIATALISREQAAETSPECKDAGGCFKKFSMSIISKFALQPRHCKHKTVIVLTHGVFFNSTKLKHKQLDS